MSLYNSLIDSFSKPNEPARPLELAERPLIAFGPQSSLGLSKLRPLQEAGAHFVLAVDDYCRNAQVEGIPVVTSKQFLECAKNIPANAVAIDFTQLHYATNYFRELARHAGIESRDLLQAQACFNTGGVYEAVQTYRARTMARADDWLKFSHRLGDDLSRETLYGVLLQRLEYDRRWTVDIKINGGDEYFGGTDSRTFLLGNREHFVDCGAHRGTVLHKFLGATSWRYAGMHAFEPDPENFSALKQLTPWPLENFHSHPYAVADKAQTLRFHQTGTMSSYISDEGTTSVKCVAVDDWVEQASFMKFDVEGFETRALHGSRRLLEQYRPRLAIAAYHYATDILDIAQTIDTLAPDYTLYLRHHYGYFFDTILYATPRTDWLPLERTA